MCFLVQGVCRPEVATDGVFDEVATESLGGVVEFDDEVKSDSARSLSVGR